MHASIKDIGITQQQLIVWRAGELVIVESWCEQHTAVVIPKSVFSLSKAGKATTYMLAIEQKRSAEHLCSKALRI